EEGRLLGRHGRRQGRLRRARVLPPFGRLGGRHGRGRRHRLVDDGGGAAVRRGEGIEGRARRRRALGRRGAATPAGARGGAGGGGVMGRGATRSSSTSPSSWMGAPNDIFAGCRAGSSSSSGPLASQPSEPDAGMGGGSVAGRRRSGTGVACGGGVIGGGMTS